MGTGIVSIGLLLDGRETLSRVLLAMAAVAWLALGAIFIRGLLDRGNRARSDAGTPAALSAVAATAVLGTRAAMLGWGWAGSTLLVIATLLWIALLGPVLRHWATPTVGVSLMLTVSTESLAVLSASVAAAERTDWLLYAALAPLLLGLAFYAFVIARFDARQLVAGRGDHWITGGALAISALAAGRITLAAHALHQLGGSASGLEALSVVLWALTIAWLPVLLGAEAFRPRLGYDAQRWSTVFPVGMYAACSFDVGFAARAPALTDFARVWVWVGVAVWLCVSLAALGDCLGLRFRRPS